MTKAKFERLRTNEYHNRTALRCIGCGSIEVINSKHCDGAVCYRCGKKLEPIGFINDKSDDRLANEYVGVENIKDMLSNCLRGESSAAEFAAIFENIDRIADQCAPVLKKYDMMQEREPGLLAELNELKKQPPAHQVLIEKSVKNAIDSACDNIEKTSDGAENAKTAKAVKTLCECLNLIRADGADLKKKIREPIFQNLCCGDLSAEESERREFCENELNALVKKIKEEVVAIIYEKDLTQKEFITIWFLQECKKKNIQLLITGEALVSITFDVLSALF